MIYQLGKVFYGGWTLLRLIAVISSSIAAILSSLLPLFLHTSLSTSYLFLMFIYLSLAALVFHGLLTHLLNDYADHLSGTDTHSPAILSGGSRVIQKGLIEPHVVWQLGRGLALILLMISILMAVVGRYELTILIIIGVWAAGSYSLPPLRLSYRPFLGEWFSLFPSILFLGLAGPWIVFESIPLWALQNGVINALVCMSWVMVHHIPDIEADKQANPPKRTTVVWFADKFGPSFGRVPAFLYLLMAGLCVIWLGSERMWAAFFLTITISYALFLIIKMDPKNIKQVTNYEKILLLLAIIIAVILGLF